MQLYLGNYAFVADVDAFNDDRDYTDLEEQAFPVVAWVWTEASFPAGFEAAKREMEADYTDTCEGNAPVFRWEPAEAFPDVTGWELWDDENEHTRVGLLVVKAVTV